MIMLDEKDLRYYGMIAAIIGQHHLEEFREKYQQGYAAAFDKVAEVSLEVFHEQKAIENGKDDFDWMEWLDENTSCVSWDDFIIELGADKLRDILENS